jgi:hypothetical protein
MNDTIKAVREAVLDAIEASLAYQLTAVRALRKRSRTGEGQRATQPSQPEVAYAVLKQARRPLHVNEIIARAKAAHGVTLARESLVSALTKKVLQHDRFTRTGRNTFGLMEGA